VPDRSENKWRREREVFAIPEEQRAAVREGLDQAERGKFASDAEMAALWKKVWPLTRSPAALDAAPVPW
jgi:predicted transcriptional regulator